MSSVGVDRVRRTGYPGRLGWHANDRDFFAATPGTQTISAGTVVSGSLTAGTLMWKAGPGTGTGTVTVTTATAKHIAGTFSFTAQGLVASTTPATRQVTAGIFDVTC